MSGPKQRILRSSAINARPSVGTRKAGELYANFPDKQLGIINEAEEAQDLIAVRYFSNEAVYVINNVILNALDGVLYQCVVNNGPGPFTSSDWVTALDSFEKRLKGFETTGLHKDLSGDLNTILNNSTYAIDSAGVVNAPDALIGRAIITTSLFSNTSNATQTIVSVTGAQEHKIWQRIRQGSVWNAWKLVQDGTPVTPAGSIVLWPTAVIPPGWFLCDGQAIVRDDNLDLFAAIGVMYGDGDTFLTFNLPDMRGRFVRGTDDGAGRDPDSAGRADRGDGTDGDAVGTTQENANKLHNHGVTDPGHLHSGFQQSTQDGNDDRTYDAGQTPKTAKNTDSATTGITIDDEGAGDSRPENINMNWIIYSGIS